LMMASAEVLTLGQARPLNTTALSSIL